MRVINRSYTSSRYCVYIDSCDELSRSIRRNSYILRLTSTASEFVGSHLPLNKRGNIMMLTLTYNNKYLPIAVNPVNGQRVPVFSRNHVKTFLNRLKVRFSRYFKGNYKYFLCMEYGKDTKRQHYHVLFLFLIKLIIRNSLTLFVNFGFMDILFLLLLVTLTRRLCFALTIKAYLMLLNTYVRMLVTILFHL